tara:strand:+ start:2140 stop:2748 length:609 start_codon:yes stop_codon:yes gene_type:complete
MTADINKTVIKGTPLHNSIKPIEEYLTAGKSDLLPKAKKTPIGKQKIRAKAETIKVRDRPPHAPVSIHSKPNIPPEIRFKAITGKINSKNKMIYFLNLIGRIKIKPIEKSKVKKDKFIRHCSASGYIPYINLLNQTLTNTQHAPSPVQSSFVLPKKLASKKNQFNKGGMYFIKIKITIKDKIALKLLEFKFLLIESKVLLPL